MQWSMTTVALAMAMVVLAGILVYAIRYKINNNDVHKERLLYFRSKAFAVSTLTVGCFFTDELPKSLFIDKMKTRPVIALAMLKLKAKALGLKVIILGFPGLLVGLLMDGDEVTDVEIVGWGMMNAPVIKRMYKAMAFKIMLKGWFFEYGLKVVTISGVYWIGSKSFTQNKGYPPVNIGGAWVACDKETNYRDIAGMLVDSEFDD